MNEQEKTQQEQAELAKFSDLTKMLVAVPKSELDEKLAEYESQKSKNKEPK